jgi:hypothetical protein
MPQTKPEHFGHAGLTGWRKTIADRTAPAVAKVGPLSEDQVRGVIGAAFFLLSAYYVTTTIVRMARMARS